MQTVKPLPIITESKHVLVNLVNKLEILKAIIVIIKREREKTHSTPSDAGGQIYKESPILIATQILKKVYEAHVSQPNCR